VFTGWGAMVAIFAVFGAPWLKERLGLVRAMYLNLSCFAVVVAVIGIWTTDRLVLVVAVIVSGVFIGVNNTITTQAVMTVSPVERPVASAAYGFVRFIGGGLAPYAARRLVIATNIHVPFLIGAGTVVLGIGILATAHRLLTDAEHPEAAGHPEAAPVPPSPRVIIAAVDESPEADLVTAAAARIAAASGEAVQVVHAQESMAEDLTAARAAVDGHVRDLVARGLRAEGFVLPHASGHGDVGRLLAEHASRAGARVIVIGAPSNGGMAALMDASASRELLRHADGNILIINQETVLYQN